MRRSEQAALFSWRRRSPSRQHREGAGVLLVARDTGRVLLGLRASWLREGSTWSTPGGLVDFRERPEAAAVRELWEEVGILIVHHSTRLLHTHVSNEDGRRYTTYVVEVAEELEARPDEHETLAAEWFAPADALEEELHPGLRSTLRAVGLA